MPAFATSTSSSPKRPIAVPTESRSPTSAVRASWPPPGSDAASAFSSSWERDTRPTVQPRPANARASDSPIPREAPVTSARVPLPSSMRSHPMIGTMSHEQATVAEEEYLQIIYWLQEAGLPITGANIARAMQVSAPTVHEMIGRLESDGYITRNEDKSLGFTDTGREHAAQIVRRHRLIERFLTDVFDIPWDQVHEEAERLEHWMSPVVEERMLRAIGDAKTCPHGHPIFEGAREDGVPLADVEEGARVRILRFENEAEDLLHYLKDTGLTPGLEGTLARSGDDEVVVEAGEDRHSVTRSVAETVSVVADPSPPSRTALPDQLVLGRERYGR